MEHRPLPEPSSYREALISAYSDEVWGAVFFERLSTMRTHAEHRAKLSQLALLEGRMIVRLRDLLEDLCIPLPDHTILVAKGLQMAAEAAILPWQLFAAQLQKAVEPFLDRYHLLAKTGLATHKPSLDLFFRHERAIYCFAQREQLTNNEHSLEEVHRILQETGYAETTHKKA
jgi:hypothetical protein